MKKNQRKKYRKGTLVCIDNNEILKSSFNSWPECKVFRVMEDCISTNNVRYVWLEFYSKGIEPKYIRMTTKGERRRFAFLNKVKNRKFLEKFEY